MHTRIHLYSHPYLDLSLALMLNAKFCTQTTNKIVQLCLSIHNQRLHFYEYLWRWNYKSATNTWKWAVNRIERCNLDASNSQAVIHYESNLQSFVLASRQTQMRLQHRWQDGLTKLNLMMRDEVQKDQVFLFIFLWKRNYRGVRIHVRTKSEGASRSTSWY